MLHPRFTGQLRKDEPDRQVVQMATGRESGEDQRTRRLEEALTAGDEAVRQRPDDALSHYARGVALGRLGRPDDALAAYDQAIKLRPDHEDSYYNRGVTLESLGRYTEALAAYDEAIRLRPGHEDSHH